MKGGVAAMIDAARVVRERGLARGRLIVAAVVDEEFASIGADALVRDWRADAAVVTEPTDLQIGVGHKGFAWLEIETAGRAAHGSRPADGRDAILRMGRVLARPRAARSRAAGARAASGHGHRLAARVDHRRRTRVEQLSGPLPCCRWNAGRSTGESAGRGRARDAGDPRPRCAHEDPEFEATSRADLFASAVRDADRITTCRRCCSMRGRGCGVDANAVGMSFWTDAAVLGEAGIPSVLFGPGGAGLHSTEEYVHVADVLACRDVLADLVAARGRCLGDRLA